MPAATLPRVEDVAKDSCYSVVETQGAIPPLWVNASVGITSDNQLFVFGGFDQYTDEMDNNVRILNLNTMAWSKRMLEQGNSIAARSGHTAIMRNTQVVIFGGEQEDREATNNIAYYDMVTNKWSLPEVIGNNEGNQFPLARSRHAACLSPDLSKMVVSGGLSPNKEVLSDLWWFEFATGQWHGPLSFVGRYDHKITLYNNKIWAFGGLTRDMDRVTEVAWYDFEANALGKVHVTSLDLLAMPSTGSGIHFYDSGYPGTMLDVVVPGTIADVSTGIASLGMDNLSWRTVVGDCTEFFSGYVWYHMVTLGSRLVMLGQPRKDIEEYDEKLSHVLTIDLSEFGYFDGAQTPISSRNNGRNGTIGDDMYEFYKRTEMCDFEITALAGTHRSVMDDDHNASQYPVDPQPIKVHMMVLAARWPHFQRILSSGMTESQDKRLFIPEPKKWVIKLIEYMYRDSIDECDIDEVTGLMILSNLYELPRLRKLCIERVSQALTFDTAVMIWERAVQANEKIIRKNAAMYCLRHWGVVVRSREFMQLDKQNMVLLCSEADERSIITTPSGRNSPRFDNSFNSNNDDDEEYMTINELHEDEDEEEMEE